MKYLLILRYQGVYFEKILKGSDISVSCVTSPHWQSLAPSSSFSGLDEERSTGDPLSPPRSLHCICQGWIKDLGTWLPPRLRLLCLVHRCTERSWRPPGGRRGEVRGQHPQGLRLQSCHHHHLRRQHLHLRLQSLLAVLCRGYPSDRVDIPLWLSAPSNTPYRESLICSIP